LKIHNFVEKAINPMQVAGMPEPKIAESTVNSALIENECGLLTRLARAFSKTKKVV